MLPPHYCRLGVSSIPFRANVNNKQWEMRGLFMSLVIHYWIGDVQDSQGVSASKMTYIVSGRALNSIHSPIYRSYNYIPIRLWRVHTLTSALVALYLANTTLHIQQQIRDTNQSINQQIEINLKCKCLLLFCDSSALSFNSASNRARSESKRRMCLST